LVSLLGNKLPSVFFNEESAIFGLMWHTAFRRIISLPTQINDFFFQIIVNDV